MGNAFTDKADSCVSGVELRWLFIGPSLGKTRQSSMLHLTLDDRPYLDLYFLKPYHFISLQMKVENGNIKGSCIFPSLLI